MAFVLPGYAWVLISGLSRRLNRIEQATLAFVTSLAFLSLLTAGLSLVTQHYLLFSLVISIAGALAIIGVYALKNRPKPIHFSSVKSLPKPFILCILIYAIFLAASFWSAPYYPTAEAPDLITHTHLTQTILAGDGRNVLFHGNIPVGLHFDAALVAYVLQVNSLEALRIVITPVLLVIVCLFLLSARRMFDSNSTAGIVVVAGALVLPVDLIHFLRIGTYPNLLEDCVILCLLWLLVLYVNQPSKALGFSMILLTIAGVFIHSSFFLFFSAALVSVPLIYFGFSRTHFRNYLWGLSYSATGLMVFAAVLWPFFRGNIDRIVGGYVELGQPLIPAFLWISYFNFSYDLGYFLGWVNVAALFAAVLLAVFMRKKSVWSVLLLVWLGIQFVSPLFSEQSYRFVLFGMLPASFIIGKGLAELRTWTLSLPDKLRTFKAWLVPLLLLVLILSGSLPGLVPKMVNPYQRSRQEAIFNSMQWLSQHSNCQVIASGGLWPDYLYLSALTSLNYTGDFFKPADVILAKSTEIGFSCIAVSTDNPYFNTFQANPNYLALYHNEKVWIFAISH
ncbi:MAG: hypothetical protein ABSC50_01885 [Candidatus Bathyarchaeia archaeon]